MGLLDGMAWENDHPSRKKVEVGPIFSVGMSAIEMVAEYSKLLTRYDTMRFVMYRVSKNIEENEDGPEERFEKYVKIAFEKDEEPKGSDHIIEQPANEVTVDWLNQVISAIPKCTDGRCNTLGISTCVHHHAPGIDVEIFIPMIDFKLGVSPENLAKIEKMVRLAGLHGLILASGRSYHFYGTSLMNRSEWYRFMTCVQLVSEVKNGEPSNIADVRWTARSKKRGFGTLRISKGGTMRNMTPEVVSVIMDPRRICHLKSHELQVGIKMRAMNDWTVIGKILSVDPSNDNMLKVEFSTGDEKSVKARDCLCEIVD